MGHLRTLFFASILALPVKGSILSLNVSSAVPTLNGSNGFRGFDEFRTASTGPLLNGNIESSTGIGVLGLPAGASISVSGRSDYGNHGARLSGSLSGDSAGSVTAEVRSLADDNVSFNVLSGTPAFLAVDLSVDGSGSLANNSYWSAGSGAQIGSATFLHSYSCQFETPCSGFVAINGVVQSAGASTSLAWVIPLLLAQGGDPNAGAIFVRTTLNLGGVASYRQLDPNGFASVSADYYNSSRLGGFRILDANLNPIAATFTSESSHDYAAPLAAAVPEPSIWLTVLSALVVLSAQKRRFTLVDKEGPPPAA